MKKIFTLLIVCITVSGCMKGHDIARTGSSIKYLTGSSTSKAGLSESLINCLTDALDPMNRGSRCN